MQIQAIRHTTGIVALWKAQLKKNHFSSDTQKVYI